MFFILNIVPILGRKTLRMTFKTIAIRSKRLRMMHSRKLLRMGFNRMPVRRNTQNDTQQINAKNEIQQDGIHN